jgi:hypothetical protein
MSVSFPTAPTASPAPSIAPSKSASATSLAAKPAETAAQKFMDYANMTPAQRMQAEMMSQLGITEDQFKAMSPADQAKGDGQDQGYDQTADPEQRRPARRADHRHVGLSAARGPRSRLQLRSHALFHVFAASGESSILGNG